MFKNCPFSDSSVRFWTGTLIFIFYFPKEMITFVENMIDHVMVVERVDNEIVIRLPSFMNVEAMQRTIDLISLKEATARSVATQRDIDLLAKEVNKGWWVKNRERYIK